MISSVFREQGIAIRKEDSGKKPSLERKLYDTYIINDKIRVHDISRMKPISAKRSPHLPISIADSIFDIVFHHYACVGDTKPGHIVGFICEGNPSFPQHVVFRISTGGKTKESFLAMAKLVKNFIHGDPYKWKETMANLASYLDKFEFNRIEPINQCSPYPNKDRYVFKISDLMTEKPIRPTHIKVKLANSRLGDILIPLDEIISSSEEVPVGTTFDNRDSFMEFFFDNDRLLSRVIIKEKITKEYGYSTLKYVENIRVPREILIPILINHARSMMGRVSCKKNKVVVHGCTKWERVYFNIIKEGKFIGYEKKKQKARMIVENSFPGKRVESISLVRYY